MEIKQHDLVSKKFTKDFIKKLEKNLKQKKIILEVPTREKAGIMIYNNNVYHFINKLDVWVVCGDCKTSDSHIIKLIIERRQQL